MTEILVTKPDTLNRRDKSALRRAGIVVVESDDPTGVKLISADRGEMSASGMLLACLRAISKDDWTGNVAHKLPGIMLGIFEAEIKARGEVME